MRTPSQVWEAVGNDDRWLDDQVAVVAEIMREAFAAGFAAGSAAGADRVVSHAEALGQQLAVSVPQSVPRGLLALATSVRELGRNDPVMQHALRAACFAARKHRAEGG